MGTGKTGSAATNAGPTSPAGGMEQQNPLAGDQGTRLEQAAASLGWRAHCWEARTKSAVPTLAHLPGPAFSITAWEAIGSVEGAAASHHGRGGPAPVPKEERQSDAPSPRTGGEGAARVGDNKLHESPDLGTAGEEKA